jgi:hypothetical protein
VTCRAESKLGAGFPPEVRHHTGRLCSAGSEASASLPGVNAPMQPSDSPAASADAPVSPRRQPTTVRTLVVSRPGVRPQTPGASEAFGPGPP